MPLGSVKGLQSRQAKTSKFHMMTISRASRTVSFSKTAPPESLEGIGRPTCPGGPDLSCYIPGAP